jgi:hypothetical protein
MLGGYIPMCERALSHTAALRSCDHPALQKTSASRAWSLPSLFTPTFQRARKGCLCPEVIISSSRLSMQRTGRPVFLAAKATMPVNWIDLVSFPPNPPPRRLTLETTLFAATLHTCATYVCLSRVSPHVLNPLNPTMILQRIEHPNPSGRSSPIEGSLSI